MKNVHYGRLVVALILVLTGASLPAAAEQYSDKNQCSFLSAADAETLLGAKLTKAPEMYAAGSLDAFCGYEASGSASLRLYANRKVELNDWRGMFGPSSTRKAVKGVGDYATWESTRVGGSETPFFAGIKGTTTVRILFTNPKVRTFEQAKPTLQKMFARIR